MNTVVIPSGTRLLFYILLVENYPKKVEGGQEMLQRRT